MICILLTIKAEEVLNLLQISRKTLHVYAHDGRIRYTVMPNKRYDYNEEDVYKILNKDVKRKTVLYARVSTSKQKNDLQNHMGQMKQWCFMKWLHHKRNIFGHSFRHLIREKERIL